jgi:hypothetical protein
MITTYKGKKNEPHGQTDHGALFTPTKTPKSSFLYQPATPFALILAPPLLHLPHRLQLNTIFFPLFLPKIFCH